MGNFASTGVLSLDCMLGGGWPAGSVAELYGDRGTGRTTLALHAVAAAQADRRAAVGLISLPGPGADNAFDVGYCRRLGINHERVTGGVVHRPELIAPYLKAFTCAKRARALDLVVVELGGLKDRSAGDREYLEGLLAIRLRLITAHKRSTTVLFVTDGAITPLYHYALTRVKLSFEGDDICGNAVVSARVDKCATAPVGRECSLQITPGDGVDQIRDLARAAAFAGVLKSCDLDDMCEQLRADTSARERLTRIVKSKLALGALAS